MTTESILGLPVSQSEPAGVYFGDVRTRAEIESCFAPREALDGIQSFFLVGIGGAGMSALARMLHRRGYRVDGNDAAEGGGVDEVRRLGVPVTIGHSAEGIEPGTGLVLTDAIDLKASPEVARAAELGLPLFRRSQVLGWLLRARKIIAVTGTHGKTTTTGMIGAGLRAAGLDPTVVVGAEVPEFGGAVVEGEGEWAVIEACEAYDSLRDFDADLVVLTNLELDHVDFHENWAGLKASVQRFVERIRPGGSLLFCEEDGGAAEVGRERGIAYRLEPDSPQPSLLPGRHNRLNAEAALKASILAGADPERARAGIEAFGGAGRRLQVLREGPITVVDDYAHHPTEINASIQALRERYPCKRLVVVYQPHLYSRTADLIPEFAAALSQADLLVLTDIYPAREAPMPGVSSARIAEACTCEVLYMPQRRLLPRVVVGLVEPDDVVVGMGAGTISDFAPAFLDELDRSGPTRVAVVHGGDSAEREISLHSGQQVLVALQSRGYEAWLLDVSEALLGFAGSQVPLAKLVGPDHPDVAFLAVHGTHAEDGAIQGFFELLHIPYTGSGIQTSAMAMDKNLTKKLLAAEGLPVPKGLLADNPEATVFEAEGYVVKPNEQGSTVGLTFVDRREDIPAAIRKALQYGSEALVEERIRGIEISVPVLGDRVLPVVEIVPASGEYDFASKYLPGATEEICPARISAEETVRAQDYALRAHRVLRCQGATRTDMIVRPDGECVVLEVNTLPGMTATSLLPNSAKVAGMSFEDLCAWIVEDARARSKATRAGSKA